MDGGVVEVELKLCEMFGLSGSSECQVDEQRRLFYFGYSDADLRVYREV